MLILFFFASVSTVSIAAVSLAEVNPFRAKPLPMVEQIELFMNQNTHEAPRLEALQLAA